MDIRELFAERTDVLFARLAGFARTRIVPIRISSFESMIGQNEMMFNVVLAEDSVAEHALKATLAADRDWMHISMTQREGMVHIDQLNDSTFADYFRRVVRGKNDAQALRLMSFWTRPRIGAGPHLPLIVLSNHNETRPNERALSAMRITQRGVQPMSPKAKDLYVSGSVRIARTVQASRWEKLTLKHGIPPHVNDFVSPLYSVMWAIAGADLRERLIGVGVSKQEVSFILGSLNRSGYAAELRWEGETGEVGEFGDVMVAVLSTRSAELRAFTSALIDLQSGLRLLGVATKSRTESASSLTHHIGDVRTR